MPAICPSCSTATRAMAISTTCAAWCASSSSAVSRAFASKTSSFPKTNSFLNGERQPLADIEEFVGKIAAGKDTQQDANFSIVARVEALIAGWGMDEALRRAEAYRLAGADAILIHSKLSKPDEIVTFAQRVGAPLATGDRTDALLQHADRGVPPGRHQHRHLGESPGARGGFRDAKRRQGDFREPDAGQLSKIALSRSTRSFRLQDADEYSAAERHIFIGLRRAARRGGVGGEPRHAASSP